MTEDPIYGSLDMTAVEIQELMDKEGIRYLPIVNSEMKLLGLVTKSSLNKALPSDISQFSRFEISYTLSKIKVSSIMVENVVTIEEDAPVEQAARMMAERKIGTLPVVEDGILKGMISDSNIFIAMTTLLGATQPGIRITVIQPDRSGVIAKLTNAIFEEGGFLSVCVGYYPKNIEDKWISVCKVQNIEQDRLEEIINGLEDTSILDIR
jgi:acetoin utilization protein AcuB